MNVGPDTIKYIEENISGKFLDISPINVCLDLTLMARKTKAKINKWDYIKLKGLCTAKGMTK